MRKVLEEPVGLGAYPNFFSRALLSFNLSYDEFAFSTCVCSDAAKNVDKSRKQSLINELNTFTKCSPAHIVMSFRQTCGKPRRNLAGEWPSLYRIITNHGHLLSILLFTCGMFQTVLLCIPRLTPFFCLTLSQLVLKVCASNS